MPQSIYNKLEKDAKRGMTKMAGYLKEKVTKKLGLDEGDDEAEPMKEMQTLERMEGLKMEPMKEMTLQKPKPMAPMAKSEGSEEMSIEDINNKIDGIQEQLASLKPGKFKKKRALRADLEYYTNQSRRMSNMEEERNSVDDAPDMRAFDPMRPMGMR
jgi:hypothetical protein